MMPGMQYGKDVLDADLGGFEGSTGRVVLFLPYACSGRGLGIPLHAYTARSFWRAATCSATQLYVLSRPFRNGAVGADPNF